MLEKMDKDIENLVTPEKVAKFEKSDTAREVVKILGKLSADGEVEITQAVFVTIRDFLITQIILANANRSGVISNMTVGEFARLVRTFYTMVSTSLVLKITKRRVHMDPLGS